MMMLGLNGFQDMFRVPILIILNVSGSMIILMIIISKGFDKWIEKLDIQCDFVDMQKTALLETTRILGKVLEM